MLGRIALACIATLLIASASHAQDIFYTSSFEGTDGGWVGTGDWERGDPMTILTPDFGRGGIPDAATGTELWATNLDGMHSPNTLSSLSQTFDFSPLAGFPVFLNWNENLDSGGNTFDTAKVFVNGDELYLASGTSGTYDDTTDTATFDLMQIDLSAYAGNPSVTIDYQFDTTGVVERVGWYVDDITVSYTVPEPASAALLGLAGLALLHRRRTA